MVADMKFTNRANLPPHLFTVLVKAWEKAQENYAASRQTGTKVISVTELIGPSYKRRLEREHHADLTMDVLDTVPALRGSSLHHILELSGRDAPEHIPEERLETNYDGWTITGKSDLYTTKDGRLIDFKDSTVWAYIKGKREWDAQLNVLRWIRVRNGGHVSSLEIDLFCGDWRRGEAMHSDDYPERVVVMPITMWSMDEAQGYVSERLRLHAADNPAPCSDEERWTKETTYALKKNGAKRATKVYQTEAEALAATGPGFHVETRPGERTRCMSHPKTGSYCLASKFCPTWKMDTANPANAVTEEIAV